jgi:hypothetical protein
MQLARAKPGEDFSYTPAMATRPKLIPVEVLQRLLRRLEKRMESLQRVKLRDIGVVVSELEVEQDYLRRTMRYLQK